jgi:hypothetical protein
MVSDWFGQNLGGRCGRVVVAHVMLGVLVVAALAGCSTPPPPPSPTATGTQVVVVTEVGKYVTPTPMPSATPFPRATPRNVLQPTVLPKTPTKP